MLNNAGESSYIGLLIESWEKYVHITEERYLCFIGGFFKQNSFSCITCADMILIKYMVNTQMQLHKTALQNPLCHGKTFKIMLLFGGWGFFPLKKPFSAFSHTPYFIKDIPQIQMSRHDCFVNLG